MKRAWIIVIVSPYVIAFAPNTDDSLTTSVEFAYGAGSYNIVTRDCNGNTVSVNDHAFTEGGVSVSHRFSEVKVGIKGGATSANRALELGTVTHRTEHLWYVNPTAGLQYRSFGGDLGLFIPLNENKQGWHPEGTWGLRPTFDLRFGPLDKVQLTLSYGSNLPLTSRGGLADIGLGFSLDQSYSRLWFGVGFFPWDSPVLVTKTDFSLTPHLGINLGGQIGPDTTPLEYGVSLGGTIRF